jgi:hypothetical protein
MRQTCLVAFLAALLTGITNRAGAAGCTADLDRRALDFWLGDWKVTTPGRSGAGTSQVRSELAGCVVVESWSNGSMHGENLFSWDPDRKVWVAFVANDAGGLHVLEGRTADGGLRLEDALGSPPGSAREPLRRVRIVPAGHDAAEQSWEKSSDGGSTWTLEYRGDYARTSKP